VSLAVGLYSEKFKETKTKFSTVLPNCEDEKCLKFMFGIDKGPYKGWICKRPKKQSNKEIINEKKRRHEGAKQRMNQAKKTKKRIKLIWDFYNTKEHDNFKIDRFLKSQKLFVFVTLI
jgi:hypothetical protein